MHKVLSGATNANPREQVRGRTMRVERPNTLATATIQCNEARGPRLGPSEARRTCTTSLAKDPTIRR
eukprot:2677591-Pyramimonas_sp.AAC.1